MTFREWYSAPRSGNRWDSWWSMLVTIPLVMGIAFTFPASRREAQVASRQQTTHGVVTSYQPSDHNRCSYTFVVLRTHYTGRDSAPRHPVAIGEQVIIYYDSQNPELNALDDFAHQSGQDQGFSIICLVMIGVVASFVFVMKLGKTLLVPKSHV